MTSDLRPVARVPVLMLGMLSLLGGVMAGLARLDWSMPEQAVAAAGWHGALMISAFLGTVISLERAVALARRWAYLAPGLAGVGGVSLLAGAPLAVSQILSIMAALILVAASVQVLRRLTASFTVVLALAAGCWLVGNLAWLGEGSLSVATPWWLAFLVLTIAGERLELTRFLPTPPIAQRLFIGIVAGLLAGASLCFWFLEAGLALFAGGLLALAVWLFRYDLARRNVQQQGLTRFIAVCLLSGYAWLALAGILGLAGGFTPGHSWRDGALHAVTLGFVFSMIFGHAPIIFPAVVRIRILYRPVFYLPLGVLHASLLLRVAGSLGEDFALRHQGGMLNAVAVALFIVVLLASVMGGKRTG
ncbi:MAG: hypothetical protein PHW25_19910 [Zoogloea sp.]|uniref:hypothetical protein n=1 Tax=Zoogloea sp. TaxID=49181 RepID=UPI00262CD35C|nr:hypothetical protein [Zoogloea sp.]MDD3329350.1 hypothetical protein [Zoogloea sp.]